MKRLIAILMVLMLLPLAGASASSRLTGSTASGSGEGYASLVDAVAAYLDSQGYTYSYDTDRNRYSYSMSINSTLSKCDVAIFIKEDGFTVYAYSPVTPKADDPQMLAAVAEYLTRANYGLNLGNFEMDFNDGEVRYKTSIKTLGAIPTLEQIEWLVDMPVLMIQAYGDGLARVIMVGADPKEEAELADSNL